MTLPADVRSRVESRLTETTGAPTRITGSAPIGGGCINPSARIETDSGDAFFLKWNRDVPADFFRVEARGLTALAEPGALRTPEVVGVSAESSSSSDDPHLWLLLEFVERGAEDADYGARLGTALATHHEATRGPEHGGPDNYIGPLPQSGTVRGDWADFWWEERLRPRWESVARRGHLAGSGAAFERLRDRLPALLEPVAEDGMSLLHGDLWSGNVFAGPDGEPVLVDPSVYRGHREVDLAMTALFGGFGAGFYRAYEERWPLLPGHEERRHLYQLYPLLVHVELFGSGYESGVRSALAALT